MTGKRLILPAPRIHAVDDAHGVMARCTRAVRTGAVTRLTCGYTAMLALWQWRRGSDASACPLCGARMAQIASPQQAGVYEGRTR